MFNCLCCGADVTSPYFYNGGVYGWTCIKKVNQNVKRNKPKTKCVEVDVLKVKFESENLTRGQALISINGIRSAVTARRYYMDGIMSDFIEIGNFKFHDGKWWAFV